MTASDPTPAAPEREWMCQGCGNLNGHGLTAIPWNCLRCGLPHTARSYPAYDLAAGKIVYGPFANAHIERERPATARHANVNGILSDADLDAITKRAYECDDEERQRRGKWPRRTRCTQCATILTLVAHIRLTSNTEAQHERSVAV